MKNQAGHYQRIHIVHQLAQTGRHQRENQTSFHRHIYAKSAEFPSVPKAKNQENRHMRNMYDDD